MLGHDDPLGRVSEPNPGDLPEHLREQVRTGERGPFGRYLLCGDAGRIREDLLGQIRRPQQRQIIPASEPGDPRLVLRPDILFGPSPPSGDQLRQGS